MCASEAAGGVELQLQQSCALALLRRRAVQTFRRWGCVGPGLVLG